MKKLLALLLAFSMIAVMFAGCEDGDKPEDTTAKPDSTQSNSSQTDTTAATDPVVHNPDVAGEVYDTGEFMALVPEGWAAFPITDVFSDDSAADTSCFNIIKDGTSDLDLFSKPYVRLDYYGPDTMMMKPSSEYYENVQDVAPVQLGDHLWSGFIGEDGYGKSAVLWLEEGNIQYQAIIWLEVEGKTISLDDPDVQAILASVAPSDGSAAQGSTGTGETVAAGNFDWWENEWYGWWAIKNGTGAYQAPSDQNIVWDAFAEVDVYNDNTGRVRIWDTGTTLDEPLIIAYDVTFENGLSELGRLVSARIDFFPNGWWNGGMAADTMSEREVGWTVDPADSTVSHFENMLEIKGHYESPENPGDSFDYYIYLRPWGVVWDDVRNGNTEGCLYKDMMPLYHDNWYISLLTLGYEHPTATFQEGIDAINNYLALQQNAGGALNPAGKEGADGMVTMAKLKEMLPWCKTETDYSMTYDEIAAKFGAHGKALESLFENKTIYRWIASENDYIQITFDVQSDGTETYNVTQWQGIE